MNHSDANLIDVVSTLTDEQCEKVIALLKEMLQQKTDNQK